MPPSAILLMSVGAPCCRCMQVQSVESGDQRKKQARIASPTHQSGKEMDASKRAFETCELTPTFWTCILDLPLYRNLLRPNAQLLCSTQEHPCAIGHMQSSVGLSCSNLLKSEGCPAALPIYFSSVACCFGCTIFELTRPSFRTSITAPKGW